MTTTVRAYQKFIRQSPRKVRLVADLIRGKKVSDALIQLSVAEKRAAEVMTQVVTQAKHNAVNNSGLVADSLVVDTVVVEEGPTFRRWQPVSRGRAHPILKRTCHIKVIVSGEEPSTA